MISALGRVLLRWNLGAKPVGTSMCYRMMGALTLHGLDPLQTSKPLAGENNELTCSPAVCREGQGRDRGVRLCHRAA